MLAKPIVRLAVNAITFVFSLIVNVIVISIFYEFQSTGFAEKIAKDSSSAVPLVVTQNTHSGELHSTVIDNKQSRKGETLYNIHCVACHQVEAKGKVGFAPSIRNRDFLAISSDDFIRQTVLAGRPGTAMPARPDLKAEDINAIIAYLRSLPFANKVEIEVNPNKKYQGDSVAGERTYITYCASCHGDKGIGYSAGGSGPSIGLPGFLNVASDDYIFQTVKLGRVGTPMRSFMGPEGIANLSENEVANVITYLRSLQSEPKEATETTVQIGDPLKGNEQFNINCAACHQSGGVGKVGFAPSIRNRDFLAIASDRFIKQTIREGRPGTTMVGRPDLSDKAVEDIIAYLRALPRKNINIDVDPQKVFFGNLIDGKHKFTNYCASCHGDEGKGYSAGGSGPGIGLHGFLNAASDDYIFQTVKRGRIGTAMKPFMGAEGIANLAKDDVHDIIVYLRSLNQK